MPLIAVSKVGKGIVVEEALDFLEAYFFTSDRFSPVSKDITRDGDLGNLRRLFFEIAKTWGTSVAWRYMVYFFVVNKKYIRELTMRYDLKYLCKIFDKPHSVYESYEEALVGMDEIPWQH
jgi:hypothetical protein